MPADFSEYVDLRPFDLNPGDIYLTSIDIARLTLPEFNLRVGTPEDAIFQAMAYMSALNIAAINRLPSRLMAGILLMMGVERIEGAPAEMGITITADSYDGAVIPIGSLFSFSSTFEDEVQEFIFETTELLEIAEKTTQSGSYPSGTVNAQCITAGVIPLPETALVLSILTSGLNIINAEVGSYFANGANEDTDAEYLSRCVTYLSSLSRSLNKSSQVDSYLLTNYSGLVGRAKTYDLTNGTPSLGETGVYRAQTPIGLTRNTGVVTLYFTDKHQFISGEKVKIAGLDSTYADSTVLYSINSTTDYTILYTKAGSDTASVYLGASTPSVSIGEEVPGYVTIFAYGVNEYLSTADKSAVLLDVTNKSIAGLSIAIKDPDLLNLEITGTVTLDGAYDQLPLQDIVYSTLVDYLSPMNFPYTEDRIRYTTLIGLISRIPGVLYVGGLTITPVGSGWLPQITDDIQFQKKGSLPSLSSDDIDITFISVTV
jgi:hypothetical protein